MVTNKAATWLRVKVDATSPKPVENITNNTAATASAGKLPLSGTSNRVTASNANSKKLTMPSTM